MSAINSLPARIPEKLAAVCESNRVRLEELETRMLMSRGAVHLLSPLPSEIVETPFVETSESVIVVRESAEIIVEIETESGDLSPAEPNSEDSAITVEPVIAIELARTETAIAVVSESADSIVQTPTEPISLTVVTRSIPDSVETAPTSLSSDNVVVLEPSIVQTTKPTTEPIAVRRSIEPSETIPARDVADETTTTAEPIAAPVIRPQGVVERPVPTTTDNNVDAEPKIDPTPTINRRVAEIDDPPKGEPIDLEPEPVTDPTPITLPIYLRRVIVVTKPADKPVDDAKIDPIAEPPVSRRIEVKPVDESDQAETIEEPLSEAPVDDGSRGDETTSTDAETSRPVSAEPALSCGTSPVGRASGDSCTTSQFAIVAAPTATETETSNSASAARDSTESLELLAPDPDHALAEFLAPSTESSGVRAESAPDASNPDPLLSSVIPEAALADALSNSFAETSVVVDSEIGDGMVVAGVFALALAKPISRLSLPDSSSLSDGSQPIALPFTFSRRRRNTRADKSGTKDNPERPDEELPQGSEDSEAQMQSHGTSKNPDRSVESSHYETYEAAILSFLPISDDDDSSNSATEHSPFSTARSFAAGALAAATAFFTLQGSRRPERSRVHLHPVTPSYRGPTVPSSN